MTQKLQPGSAADVAMQTELLADHSDGGRRGGPDLTGGIVFCEQFEHRHGRGRDRADLAQRNRSLQTNELPFVLKGPPQFGNSRNEQLLVARLDLERGPG